MSRPDISKPLFGWGTALKGQGDLTGMKEYKDSVLSQNEIDSAKTSDSLWGNSHITTGFTSQHNDILSGATASVASVHNVTMSDGDNFGNVSTNSATGAIEVNSAVYGTLDYGAYGKSYAEIFGDVAGSFLSEMSNSNTPNTNGFSGYGMGMNDPSTTTQRTDMYGNVIYTVGIEDRVDIGGTTYRVNMDGSQTQLDLAGNPVTTADNTAGYGWGNVGLSGWGTTVDAKPQVDFYGNPTTLADIGNGYGVGIGAPSGWGTTSDNNTSTNYFWGSTTKTSGNEPSVWGDPGASIWGTTASSDAGNSWWNGGNKTAENNFYDTKNDFWNRSEES